METDKVSKTLRFSEYRTMDSVQKSSNPDYYQCYDRKYVVNDIVTDLIRALQGNGSVNSPTYTGGQQYSGGVL
jgi:hypothetical protein